MTTCFLFLAQCSNIFLLFFVLGHKTTKSDIKFCMDTSFLELRCKEVVNVVDGRRLGHIVDVVFNLANCCLLGVVVPGEKSFWNVFKGGTELFIPISQIVKIGEDAVLVELFATTSSPYVLGTSKKKDGH